MRKNLPLVCFLTLGLSGCAWLAPSYERPQMETPPSWLDAAGTQAADPFVKEWWLSYQDPVLTKLIDEALTQNDDLGVAAARLAQAKAQYDYAFADQFPLLSLTGYASRSKIDFKDSTLLSDKPSNIGVLGGLLSYEVDLWGKMASANAAAKASFLAVGANRDAVKLSVAAGTAQLYFSLLALDADVDLIRKLVKAQEETHALVKKQYEVAAASAVVLRQSEAGLAAAKASLPPLLQQKEKAESALATILGRSPRDIVSGKIERGAGLGVLPVPPIAPGDLPSVLIERRPDIAAREQAMIASNFNIGYVRASYFPTISLSNLLGVTSLDLDNLYKGTVRTWDLGGTMAGPLIDFGRTDSGVDLAKAENQEQLAFYKQTVRTAFKEVRDALSDQDATRDAEGEQVAKEEALSDSLRLARARLASGFVSALDVHEAERSLYEAQMARIAAKLNRLNASVDLYKALGGGYSQRLTAQQ